MAKSDLMEVGFIIFHELIHIVSIVVDADVGYGKGPLVDLATTRPEVARVSANNYMLYTAQNGLSYRDYTEISTGWGLNVHDPTCTDSFTNCLSLAQNCCGDTKVGSTVLSEGCCASCTVFDSTPECINILGVGPEDGIVRDADSRGGYGGISEEDLIDADGQFGCGDSCSSSIECFTGMGCD
jgi:hypothetical protein